MYVKQKNTVHGCSALKINCSAYVVVFVFDTRLTSQSLNYDNVRWTFWNEVWNEPRIFLPCFLRGPDVRFRGWHHKVKVSSTSAHEYCLVWDARSQHLIQSTHSATFNVLTAYLVCHVYFKLEGVVALFLKNTTDKKHKHWPEIEWEWFEWRLE